MNRIATFAVLGLATFGLAACGSGGGDEAMLVELCMEEDGKAQEKCECEVGKVMENLSDEHKDMLMSMARLQKEKDLSEEEASQALMEEYDMGQLMAFGLAVAGPMMTAESECQ